VADRSLAGHASTAGQAPFAGQASAIELRGLRALGRHGVSDEERSAEQPFEIDIDVAVDTTLAASSDDVADTVDYQALAVDACEVVEKRSFRLLEALAEAVARVLLGHEAVLQVTVSVRKLRPPVPLDLASAGVRITRARD
jgi:FolB domain-containing protein